MGREGGEICKDLKKENTRLDLTSVDESRGQALPRRPRGGVLLMAANGELTGNLQLGCLPAPPLTALLSGMEDWGEGRGHYGVCAGLA